MLRWTRHDPDWRGYAIGYRRAADALAQETTSGVSLDLVVFPLAGLYRHALELHLKWLTVAIREELGTSTALLMTHDIERLWHHLREPLRPLGLRDSDWEDLDAKVLALSRLDPKGEGFRYPVTVGGEPSLTIHALNLELFAQTSAQILCLGGPGRRRERRGSRPSRGGDGRSRERLVVLASRRGAGAI